MLNRVLRAFTRAFTAKAETHERPPHELPTPAFRARRLAPSVRQRPRKLVRLFRTSNGHWSGNP